MLTKPCHLLFQVILIVCLFDVAAIAGTRGIIVCRPLGSISITIDGDFSDWPLDQYEQASEQPLYPDAQLSESTDAYGDYIVYYPDRVVFFNTDRGAVSEDDENIDFEVNTYFAYDSEFLYVLSVFVDDEIRDELDTTEFGSTPSLNDGIEFFFDANNDSDDCASEIEFANFDAEEPNLDDFQIATGLNLTYDSVIPFNEGGLGARQGIERSGNVELFGETKFFDGLYQQKLDETEGADIAAKMYEDLRAAGAPNAAIAANPDLNFAGYALEIRIPFGVIQGFTPDHSMGFDLFWRNVDWSSVAIQFIDWGQNTIVDCRSSQSDALFYTPNWAEMQFNTDKPLDSAKVNEWTVH